MDALQTRGSLMGKYRALRSRIIQKAMRDKIPVLGEFELTPRCNLKCSMCFVRESAIKLELSTEEWKRIFDMAVDNGLMFATLTGGEIMMREDFIELYEYLYDKGVRITLFSNGTMFSDEALDALSKRPPEYISITLYGATNETYEAITNVKNGFDIVKRGIETLRRKGIHVALKTIPLKGIMNDLDHIIDFVKSYDLDMNYFLYVGPTRDLRNHPLNERLSPRELVRFEQTIRNAFDKPIDETFENTETPLMCAALKSAYFVNWRGKMLPCAMVPTPGQYIKEDFKDTYDTLRKRFYDIEVYDQCKSCDLRSQCIQCYARRYLEGDSEACAPYLKAHATLRGENDGKV